MKNRRNPWYVIAWRAPWAALGVAIVYVSAALVCFCQLMINPKRVPETWGRIISAL